MTATAGQWKMYQAVKASLRQEQQNVLTVIEGYLKSTEPDYSLGGIEVFNDRVNDWRGGEYSPAENKRFLNELAEVNFYDTDKFTIQKPFDSVKLSGGRRAEKFSIKISDYYSKVIGEYIRDERGCKTWQTSN